MVKFEWPFTIYTVNDTVSTDLFYKLLIGISGPRVMTKTNCLRRLLYVDSILSDGKFTELQTKMKYNIIGNYTQKYVEEMGSNENILDVLDSLIIGMLYYLKFILLSEISIMSSNDKVKDWVNETTTEGLDMFSGDIEDTYYDNDILDIVILGNQAQVRFYLEGDAHASNFDLTLNPKQFVLESIICYILNRSDE